MLSPRYLDGVADELIEIYSQLESDILQDMARRIARLSKITESTKWQASVLAETGALKKDVIKIIKQYDTQIQDELLAVFNDAVEKSTKADNKIFKDAIGKEVTEKNTQLMLANIQKTRADLSRLTITTAYDTEKMFVQQANNAYMQTVSGAFDYDTAMKNACDNLAKDGITSVFYKNTKPVRLTIESAVRMNILTGINQTAATITQNNCIELGCDLVETSAHIGARPEHEEWQGQIFSLSGTSDKYKPFSVCRLGEATGICGINCRHSYYPYFEGLEKHYTQDDLDEMASQTVEYNGQKMTRYEGEQNLRHIERNIRKYKRQALTQQAGGVDSTQARTKLGQWQAKARDFTKQTGIKRDSAREYIGTDGKQPRGIKPTASQKVTVGAKPTKATATSTATATASTVATVTTDTKTKAIDSLNFINNDIRATDTATLKTDLRKVETNHLERLEKHASIMRGEFYGNAGKAYYSPLDNRIYLDINRIDERSKVLGFQTNITTFLHESGHWLDYNMLGNEQTVRSQLPALREYLRKDAFNYINNLIKPKNVVKSIADIKRLGTLGYYAIVADVDNPLKNGISDIFSGLLQKRMPYYHKPSYWKKRTDKLETETIAHFFEVLGVGGQKKDILKQYFPTAFKYFEDFINGVS